MMLPEEEEIEARVNSCIRGALDTISSSPRYQCHLLILLLILFQTMSFSAWGVTLFYANPQFECEGTTDLVLGHEACSHLDIC